MSIVRVERDETGGDEPQYTVVESDTGAAWSRDRQFQVVGKPLPRVEGDLKVTGKAQYAYDVRLPGQLYARVLRSPHPHARVVRIDATKAEMLNGVPQTEMAGTSFRATLPNPDAASLRTFYTEHAGMAPENFCADGAYP